MSTREIRRAGRTPHLSARPPKNSMEMVMPDVSTPTIQPAAGRQPHVLVEVHGQIDDHAEVDQKPSRR